MWRRWGDAIHVHNSSFPLGWQNYCLAPPPCQPSVHLRPYHSTVSISCPAMSGFSNRMMLSSCVPKLKSFFEQKKDTPTDRHTNEIARPQTHCFRFFLPIPATEELRGFQSHHRALCPDWETVCHTIERITPRAFPWPWSKSRFQAYGGWGRNGRFEKYPSVSTVSGTGTLHAYRNVCFLAHFPKRGNILFKRFTVKIRAQKMAGFIRAHRIYSDYIPSKSILKLPLDRTRPAHSHMLNTFLVSLTFRP